MKIWMSGEVQGDVYERYASVRKEIEATINAALSDRDYGPGLIKLAYIAIIRAIESDNFNEVQKYTMRDRVAEFRLKISHDVFLRAGNLDQMKLVAASVLRAIKMLPSLNIREFDCAAFESQIDSLAEEKGWL